MFTLKHITSTKVREVIKAAHAANASRGALKNSGTLEPTREVVALTEYIEALGPGGTAELEALMILGRGDLSGSAAEFALHRDQGCLPEDQRVDYIAAKSPALPEYLETALAYVDGRRRSREAIIETMVEMGYLKSAEELDDAYEAEFSYDEAVKLLGETYAAQIWRSRGAEPEEDVPLSVP
jgi:hypothetical protein